jgi:hypothetical protein
MYGGKYVLLGRKDPILNLSLPLRLLAGYSRAVISLPGFLLLRPKNSLRTISLIAEFSAGKVFNLSY